MTVIIIAIIFVGLLFIAFERTTRMNSSAIAVFMGISCWALYVITGTNYIDGMHHDAFRNFLQTYTGDFPARAFIARKLFLPYLSDAAEIVLFLLCTMTIVEVLNNNGCFDFIQEWLRSRSPKRFMWTLTLLTMLLSVNMDNLTATCIMLSLLQVLLQSDRQRRIYGVVVVIAANIGGAMTVIGDVTSLAIWQSGVTSATRYTSDIFLPLIVGLGTTLLLIQSLLPYHLDLKRHTAIYRGDDTVLNRWQRLLMLFVGLGGLWFIPTFHRLTTFPPLVGAMCVLGVLWIVNELVNRKLISSHQQKRNLLPLALQYANVQKMFFFIGTYLAIGALAETGFRTTLWQRLPLEDLNIYVAGTIDGALASVFGHMSVVLGNVTFFANELRLPLEAGFASQGLYWPLMNYCAVFGGLVFCVGALNALYLAKLENIPLGWYIKHFSWRILAGGVAGLFTFFVIHTWV